MKTTGIILGKGTPNRCRDGKATQCAIALSPEIGLFRCYPLNVIDHRECRLWTNCAFDLERSNKDSRAESWKVLAAEPINEIKCAGEKEQILNQCVLQSGEDDPIDFQNERRASILLVPLNSPGAGLERRDVSAANDDGEDGWVSCQCDFTLKPMLTWQSLQGKAHKSHIVAQEVYEGIRRNPSSPYSVFDNLQLAADDYQHWLLMGNMRDHRNIWVAVHVHRIKKHNGGSIPLFSEIVDGRPADWPYSAQGDGNAKPAEPQLEFSIFTISDTTSVNGRGNTRIATFV